VVCETLGMAKPVILNQLIERNFGEMTGKPISDIERLCAPNIIKTDTVTYFLSPLGAETFPDLLKRAGQALNQIRAEHSTGSILLVTHGDLGKMLYAAHYGLPWQKVLTGFHFGNCELLLLADGENPNEPHVVKIDQHNH